VRDTGPADGEAVVCLHGFPQDATAYDGVAARLSEAGLRVLAPDQRGYSPTRTSSATTGAARSHGHWRAATPTGSAR
jgi:pimeloyl-ACP methyl ester carboxylesterase